MANTVKTNTEGRTAFTLLHIAHPIRRPVSHDELVEAFSQDQEDAGHFPIEDFELESRRHLGYLAGVCGL